MNRPDNSTPPPNRLLASLPRADYESLLPIVELVRFPKNRILYEAGELVHYGYFPTDGMASLLATLIVYPVTIVAEVVILRRGQRALLSGGR